jgi:hypothetical protein
MMHDLKELEVAWRELERRADAHPLVPFTPSAARSKRRSARTWLAVTGSAVAVAAAVTVPMALAGGGAHRAAPNNTHTSASQPVASQSTLSEGTLWSSLPTDHYRFVFDNGDRTRITSVLGIGPNGPANLPNWRTYQEIQTHGPYGDLVFKVNAPGAWSPPTDATQTTVNGRPAYYGLFVLHPEIPQMVGHPRQALAWQYAPGAWVDVANMSQVPIDLDYARTVATHVHIADGGPIPDPAPGWTPGN